MVLPESEEETIPDSQPAREFLVDAEDDEEDDRLVESSLEVTAGVPPSPEQSISITPQKRKHGLSGMSRTLCSTAGALS